MCRRDSPPPCTYAPTQGTSQVKIDQKETNPRPDPSGRKYVGLLFGTALKYQLSSGAPEEVAALLGCKKKKPTLRRSQIGRKLFSFISLLRAVNHVRSRVLVPRTERKSKRIRPAQGIIKGGKKSSCLVFPLPPSPTRAFHVALGVFSASFISINVRYASVPFPG